MKQPSTYRRTAIDDSPVLASESQIAWMAALFEGEGWVSTPKSRKDTGKPYSSPLRIAIKMCDRDVLERFRDYAGGGNLTGPYRPRGLGKKDTHELTVQGSRAHSLLVAFHPWLGARRLAQVQAAIEKWKSLRPTTDGVILNQSDVAEIKRRLAIGRHGIGKELAQEYGVSDGMICSIKKGRSWQAVSASI
jgi:hypothetical protein